MEVLNDNQIDEIVKEFNPLEIKNCNNCIYLNRHNYCKELKNNIRQCDSIDKDVHFEIYKPDDFYCHGWQYDDKEINDLMKEFNQEIQEKVKKCKHENFATHYTRIPGETAEEPSYDYCSECGAIFDSDYDKIIGNHFITDD